ncbi:MAG TPA: hypothetical protein VM345_12735 [Acidimicrobiales bacterium]|nr:hypothetical protein [Acidimicrobiales bacterium]
MTSPRLGHAEVASLEIARRFARTLATDDDLSEGERAVIARGLLHHLEIVWRAVAPASSERR